MSSLTKPFMSITEIAEAMGLSYQVIRKRILDGSIPSIPFGKTQLVKTETIENILKYGTTNTKDPV